MKYKNEAYYKEWIVSGWVFYSLAKSWKVQDINNDIKLANRDRKDELEWICQK